MPFLADFFRGATDRKVVFKPVSSATADDARYRAVGIRPADGCCEAARQFGQMRFLGTKAPRLPVPECTAATCNCRYVHYSDRRTGRDRRRVYDWARERDLDVVNRRSGRGRRSNDPVV